MVGFTTQQSFVGVARHLAPAPLLAGQLGSGGRDSEKACRNICGKFCSFASGARAAMRCHFRPLGGLI